MSPQVNLSHWSSACGAQHCKAALSCRTLLAREQGRIRAEYEERVRQLEQERQGVEEERVQVASKQCSHCVGLSPYST